MPGSRSRSRNPSIHDNNLGNIEGNFPILII